MTTSILGVFYCVSLTKLATLTKRFDAGRGLLAGSRKADKGQRQPDADVAARTLIYGPLNPSTRYELRTV